MLRRFAALVVTVTVFAMIMGFWAAAARFGISQMPEWATAILGAGMPCFFGGFLLGHAHAVRVARRTLGNAAAATLKDAL